MKKIMYIDNQKNLWVLFTQDTYEVLVNTATMAVVGKKKEIAFYMQKLTACDNASVQFNVLKGTSFTTPNGNEYIDVSVNESRYFFVRNGANEIIKSVSKNEYFDVQCGNKEDRVDIYIEDIIKAIFKQKEYSAKVLANAAA